MPNRLAGETSPYLLQHAQQPGRLVSVGARRAGAGQVARPADLPVDRLCGLPLVPRHGARVVRGRATAAYLNEHFVSIKVDREERPDLDQLYMGGGPGDDRRRRLADVGLPDARRPAVLRRHLLPGRAAPRHAVVPPGPRGGRSRLARAAQRGRGRRVQAGRARSSTSSGIEAGAERSDASAAGGGARRDRRLVRPGQRRLGPGPQVPAADDHRVPAPPARGRRPAAGAIARFSAREDGRRRHPRPARRRLPSLLDRRDLARARTSSRCSTTTPSSHASTSMPGRRPGTRASARSRSRSSTTCSASWPRRTAPSRPARTPTRTASRASRSPGRATEIREVLGTDAGPFLAAYGVTDVGNWEGSTILSRVWPAAHTPPPARADAAFEAGSPPRGSACWSDAPRGPSRLGTTRRSRPGTGSPSRPSPTRAGCSGEDRYTAAAIARRRGDHRRAARGGRLAGALLEGRPGDGAGRPRGLRPPGRRPARAL